MSFKKIREISLTEITISKLNVRHDTKSARTDLDELAASIKEHGLLQPVVLRGHHGNPPYELIAGQRRFLAHRILKKKTISSLFVGDIDDTEATLLSLVENLQSLDLNHADTARAIRKLYKAYGDDEREIQKETGLAIQTIRDFLTIESQASPKMRRLLQEKKVTKADVKRAIRAGQGSLRKAEKLLDLMCKYPLTQHQKKRIVEYGTHHGDDSAETIVEEAMQPRVEQTMMVSLPEQVREGLEKATKSLEQDAEEIVTDVLYEWLNEQGFMDE